MSSAKNILPPAPSGLCFSKDEFLKDNFEVDKFLHDCRKRASPETLRDDLRVYHKILQNALVELINNDYADFVNLSSNLAGMDKLIGNLSQPLENFQAEIVQVQAQMTATIEAINQKLLEKSAIRKSRACLTRLAGVVRSVEMIERMLKMATDGTGDATKETGPAIIWPTQDGHLMERVAGEYSKLLCYLSELEGGASADGTASHSTSGDARAFGSACKHRIPMLAAIRPRIDGIGEAVRQRLSSRMVSALQQKNVDSLARCLRSYAAVDRAAEAEALFGQFVVRPLCDQIVQEGRLHQPQQQQQGPGNNSSSSSRAVDSDALIDLYGELVEVLTPACALLADVASGRRGTDAIEGYDFAVNGAWPEVAEAVEKRLFAIFAPGDPDAFFKRYSATLDFVEKFERQCCCTAASVHRLRAAASYTAFMGKWNVPVYFQIRQQEVTSSVEAAFEAPFELRGAPAEQEPRSPSTASPSAPPADGEVGAFSLQAVHTAWCAVRHCWAPDVYVAAAASRFWKLTLQIISRVVTWLADVEHMKAALSKRKEISHFPGDEASTSGSGPSDSQSGSAGLAAASAAPSGGTAGSSAATSAAGSAGSTSGAAGLLIALISDCLKFTSAVRGFFTHTISRKLREAGVSESTLTLYKGCLDQSCAAVDVSAEAYTTVIVDDIVQLSALCLRQVTDIPRLYRKTNRELPARPSNYVAGLTKPLVDFVRTTTSRRDATMAFANAADDRAFLPPHVESSIIRRVLSELCRQYESTATEVLTSVKKMEDSLKRLKRGKGSAVSGSATATSDDDKIRLQLALDIDAFSSKIAELKLTVNDVPAFTALCSAGAAASAAANSNK